MKYNLHQLALAAGICLTTTLAAPTAEQQLASDRYSDRAMLGRVCPPSSPNCDPELNGSNLSGYAVNSLMQNGVFQNGTSFNGQGLGANGANHNGTRWTQLTVTKAKLKEMSVREIGLEGGQLVLHASDRYSDRVMLMPVCAPGSPKCDPDQNGTNLNGYAVNGLMQNGAFQNGTSSNGGGLSLNGTGWTQLTVTTANLKEMPVREIGLEGGQLMFHIHPNGTSLNGQGLGMNGVSLNGASLNGTGWNQLTVTTANLKEMPVREIGLEGGQLVFHLHKVNSGRG